MPAVKIGRFAVASDCRRAGHGTQVMDFIKLWFIVHHRVKTSGFSRSALAETLGLCMREVLWSTATVATPCFSLSTPLSG